MKKLALGIPVNTGDVGSIPTRSTMDLLIYPPPLVAPEHIAASYLANCDLEAANKAGLSLDWEAAFTRHVRGMRRQMQPKREPPALVYTPCRRFTVNRRRKLVIGLLLAAGGILVAGWLLT